MSDRDESSDVETQLDRAVAAARSTTSDPEASDAAARLVDLLLTEALICPVWPPEDGETPTADVAPGSVISPRFVEQNGVETLPLFDTEERLAAFVDEPTEFVAAPGRAFFELAAREGVAVAINPNVASSASVYAPEAAAAIAEAARETDDALALAAGHMAAAYTPSAPPEALLAALSARVAAAQALVSEAWLIELEPTGQPDGRLLALLMRPTDAATDGALEELASELSRLGGVLLSQDAALDAVAADDPDRTLALDVGFLSGDAPLMAAARRVGFGVFGGPPTT